MNWDAIGAIGEVLSAAAVVISLVYLAAQVRQNTRSIRAASFHAITDSFNQVNALVARDRAGARLVRLGSQGLENLDEDERIQFAFFCLSALRVFETLYYESKLGTGERDLWRAEERTLRTLLSYPGIHAWWRQNTLAFTDEFRAQVESVLSRTP